MMMDYVISSSSTVTMENPAVLEMNPLRNFIAQRLICTLGSQIRGACALQPWFLGYNTALDEATESHKLFVQVW
jgi:hypothetical protein